jgi:hypothetical protein
MLTQMNITNYSAKCCYLTRVDSGHKLFAPEDYPGAASATAARIGKNKGRIAFFGDVNAETVTVSAMVAMGTGM